MHEVAARPTIQRGSVIADRFRLESEIGRGGMGSVWLAHHVALDIPCAVKFILDARADDEQGRNRFVREAQAAAKLRSPNVVQILDHGTWDSIPYIAMELLEGETLTERLSRRGRLTLAETAALVADVAAALSRAEELRIVHRDLKPDNLFIVGEPDREIVKVLDFGVAKLELGEQVSLKTASGTLIGTPHYMSPEQAHGARKVDHRSDLWSLGVIAFECVTGTPPFAGEGLGQVMNAIMSGPIPVPSQQLASLPPEFDAWFVKAAARDPEKRFQSAPELARALRAVADGADPVSVPAGLRRIVGEATTIEARVIDTASEVAAHPLPRRSRARLALAAAALSLIAAGVYWTVRGSEPSGAAASGALLEAPPTHAPQASVAAPSNVALRSQPSAPSATASVPAATASAPRARARPPRIKATPRAQPESGRLEPGY